MKLAEIVKYLDNKVPLHYQESYDNSGLLIGDKEMEIKSVLTCLDCTEDVIKELNLGLSYFQHGFLQSNELFQNNTLLSYGPICSITKTFFQRT